MIMSKTLTPEEGRRVWEQACNYADGIHQSTPTYPIGAEAVPNREPLWNYNTEAGCLQRDRFQTCILAGLQKATIKPINYNKLQEVIQDRDENPSAFLSRLTEAMLRDTNQDPETPERWQLLKTYYFS